MIKESELCKMLGVNRVTLQHLRLGQNKTIGEKTYSYEPILNENDYTTQIIKNRNVIFILDSGIEKIKAKLGII